MTNEHIKKLVDYVYRKNPNVKQEDVKISLRYLTTEQMKNILKITKEQLAEDYENGIK